MASANMPIRIGTFTVKNRLTMAPTVKFGYTDETGVANEKYEAHYGARAAAGLGLVCVEATAVLPGGRFCLDHMGLWDDAQIPGQAKIAQAIHDGGAIAIIQLNHTGGGTNPAIGEPLAPSVHEYRGNQSIEMTLDQIHEMQKAFVDAAVRAKKAGYDGIQLHACHTYLINQFESPIVNHRTDEYGGSVENRSRFASEIIREIRILCGPDFLISARISGYEESVEDSLQMGEIYVKNGCDYLQVSNGFHDLSDLPYDPSVPYNKVVQLGVNFYKHFKGRVPTSCVNALYTPELVNYLFENDLCDTVDFGRGVLADPALASAVLEGTDYVKCFACRMCQYGPFHKAECPAKALRDQKNA